MNDLITAATSGLFVEVGKVIEHMKAQQERIADLERQLQAKSVTQPYDQIADARRAMAAMYEAGKPVAKASAPAVEQQSMAAANEIADQFETGFFDDRMVKHVAGIVSKHFAAPQAADTDKVREALLALQQQLPNQTRLELSYNNFHPNDPAYAYGYTTEQVCTIIEAAADVAASMAAQAPVREVPGWIACSDRLPDMHTEVMVWPHPSDYIMTAEVDRSGTWSYNTYVNHWGNENVKLAKGRITHWQPLPAAPVQQEGA